MTFDIELTSEVACSSVLLGAVDTRSPFPLFDICRLGTLLSREGLSFTQERSPPNQQVIVVLPSSSFRTRDLRTWIIIMKIF